MTTKKNELTRGEAWVVMNALLGMAREDFRARDLLSALSDGVLRKLIADRTLKDIPCFKRVCRNILKERGGAK